MPSKIKQGIELATGGMSVTRVLCILFLAYLVGSGLLAIANVAYFEVYDVHLIEFSVDQSEGILRALSLAQTWVSTVTGFTMAAVAGVAVMVVNVFVMPVTILMIKGVLRAIVWVVKTAFGIED
jgi:hypothetical protein